MQILYHEYCCCARIPLTESVYLPQVSTEASQMANGIVYVHIGITKRTFLAHIIIQGVANGVGTGIIDCLAAKHPLIFRNVIVTNAPSLFVDAFIQTAVYRNQLCRSKRECFLFNQFRDACGPLSASSVRSFSTTLRPEADL